MSKQEHNPSNAIRQNGQTVHERNGIKEKQTTNSREAMLKNRRRTLKQIGATGVATLALLGGIKVADAIDQNNAISNAYYEEVSQYDTGLIDTANRLEEENGLDFNATRVGQGASKSESDQLGESYIPHAGDRLVAYTTENGDVVTEEVITVDEQNDNR